jgi:glycosidase
MNRTIAVTVCLFAILFATEPDFARETPHDWYLGKVWYKVLLERFRNGFTANDPVKGPFVDKEVKDWQTHPWASDFYKLQVWEEDRDEDFAEIASERRYGGDLIGVYERVLYLKRLGVDVLVLSPVFESPSVKKYDASTFHHVDNNFGDGRKEDMEAIKSEKDDPEKWTMTKGDDLFVEFLKEVHNRKVKMKVVVEASFHFCSDQFWAFRDVMENQHDSKYKDWFMTKNWDEWSTPDTVEFDYEYWQEDRHVPIFRQDENGPIEPIREYIFAITRRWMDPDGDGDPSDGIDGWYIKDVEFIPQKFWQDWLALVKKINPLAVTAAECHSSASECSEADLFDMKVQYRLADLMSDFFVHRKIREGLKSLSDTLQALAEVQGTQTILNPLTSDTEYRLSSILHNVSQRDSAAGNGHSFDPRKPSMEVFAIQNLMTVLQLTFPGAPLVIYGEESGMWGGWQPEHLKPMLWPEFIYEEETYATIRPDLKDVIPNRFNRMIFRTYAMINDLRKEYIALQKGDYMPVLTDDDKKIFAYSRKYEKNEVVVFLNLSNEEQKLDFRTEWPNGTRIKDPFNDKKLKVKEGKLALEIAKRGSLILVKEK